LVIGGGVAGLKSAIDLAKRGIKVNLIEKSGKLGGRMLDLFTIFPTNEYSRDLIQKLIQEVESNPFIKIYKNAELKDASGFVGDFNTTIAMSKPDGSIEDHELHSGAIIIAVGLDLYKPRTGEYGWDQAPEVISLLDFHKMLHPIDAGKGDLMVNGRKVKNVALIHCVGSRQWEGVHKPQADGKINDYCSRVCCTTLMHMAVEIKERFPDVNVFDFFEDIRTYARGHEEFYTKAAEEGVLFFRFNPLKPPVVLKDPTGKYPLVVRSIDRLTMDEEIEVPVDVVVLGLGMTAGDLSKLVDLYRCSRGPDRFLMEAHPKLKPVELAALGLFLAGSVQGPMDITEATAGASAAASKAAVLVTAQTMELDPFVAEVMEDKCSGCRTCLDICPFNAISRNDEKAIAFVNKALCTGCGTCVATCPSNAIKQYGFSHDEVASEVLTLLSAIAEQSSYAMAK
jgi:heterodisulfide reductase subunit A2